MGSTLVLLAAGLGQRFGGSKQATAMGPSGEWVLDYTLYDAWRAGMKRAVLIVSSALLPTVKEHIDRSWASRLELHYVLQHAPTQLPAREKPWGTGQAILCAAALLAEGPFIVANGDDFYGREALAALHVYLQQSEATQHAMVGYTVASTLSPQGGVSRALCVTDANLNLLQLEERHGIQRRADGCIVDDQGLIFAPEQFISMNLFGLQASVLPLLQQQFQEFCLRAGAKDEFYLPMALGRLLQEGLRLKVLAQGREWYGVTYAQDRSLVQAAFAAMVQAGRYPQLL